MPLLLILSLVPLSIAGLKLIAKDGSELGTQLEMVKKFSNNICMEFGIEKCAKITVEKGKVYKKQY